MFEINDEDMGDKFAHIHDQQNLDEVIDALMKVLNSLVKMDLDFELDNINDAGC